MARLPRFGLPGHPQHVIQRGNNRQSIFADDADRRQFLATLNDTCQSFECRVHAYVLMTNHVHLLMTPDTETGISQVMQSLGRRYVQYFNRRHHRTGTLWEGRYRATLVDSESYLLTCYRYIELNPVRASMVSRPDEYRWSSYGANAWNDASWITPHQEYLRLGMTAEERCLAYREMFCNQVDADDLHLIRKAAHYCQPVSDERFREEIASRYGIELGQMKRGRPCRKG